MRTPVRAAILVVVALVLSFISSAPASADTATRDVVNQALAAVGGQALTQVDDGVVSAGGVTISGRGESVARTTDTGAQVITVLRRGSTATFDVNLADGLALAFDAAGSISIKAGEVNVGSIAAPWAVDASGKRLPTSYTIRGSQLVQNVDTTRAVYPVVADPYFSLCGFLNTQGCVTFGRAGTRDLAGAALVGVGAFIGTFCGLIPWSPWYVALLKAACAAAVAAGFYSMRSTIISANNQGRCFFIRWNLIGPIILTGWGVVNCP